MLSNCCLERSGLPGGGPSRPNLSHCFLFSRLSGSALEMLSGALGPALRRALAPQLVSLLCLQQLIWQCSRNALWGARTRLAAGPRAPTLSTASSSTICIAVLSKCCLEHLGPPCGKRSRPNFVSLLRFQHFVWRCSRNALWGARARLAAGPRAPTLSTVSS